MPKRIFFLVISLTGAGICIAGVGMWFFLRPQEVPELAAAQPAVQSVVDEVLAARLEEVLASPDLAFGNDTEINILTLGLDSRKEGFEAHCDAIHLVTLNTENWTIRITSVPRGTFAMLPAGGVYKETDYYLANACAFGGMEYGIAQIEKVLGVHADYVATVGFSQALGIFRALRLPTTETLQWLRHRQGYAIGDPQRSQNQATFMKDVALRLLADRGISTPLLYILYTFIDTDLAFDQIHALYLGYLASGIAQYPDRITFDMKPYYKTEIYHFNEQDPDTQLHQLIDRLQGVLSPQDLSNKTLEEIQASLVEYLYDALGEEGTIAHVYEEQLWRQVEDEETREELHFRFLERYVREVKDTHHEGALQEVTNYILEMQFFEYPTWESRGRTLLSTLVEGDASFVPEE